jgi:hypothetical protein
MAALGIASAQPRSAGLDLLAQQLANLATRDAAVEQVVAAPATLIPVLLSWTTNPPDGVRASDLNVGLAVAFDSYEDGGSRPIPDPSHQHQTVSIYLRSLDQGRFERHA